MKIIKIFSFFISLTTHLAILVGIYKLWQPVAKWHLNQLPARGIDLFNSVSYVSYLLNNFDLRVNGWKYTWFSGVPFSLDYPFLYFYFMIPLAKIFGLVRGVQIFALAACFIFIACSYVLFASLSKNRALAAILAIAVAYSVNIYRALVYAGGIPIFTSQLFFPLVLYFIVKFVNTQTKKYLIIAGVLSGVGFLGHPQHFINYIFPSVLLLLLFSVYGKKYFSFGKIKAILIYFILAVGVGMSDFYYLFYSNFVLKFIGFLNANLYGIKQPFDGSILSKNPDVSEWARKQFFLIFTDMNHIIFYILLTTSIFFIFGIIIGKKRTRAFMNTLALSLVGIWIIIYAYLLSIGINIYQGGWEAWYKVFWPLPVALGALASQFWGVFVTGIQERVGNFKLSFVLPVLIEIISGIIFVVLGITLFSSYTSGFTERLYNIGAYPGVYPEAVGARLDTQTIKELIKEVKPEFIEDTPSKYRLYSNDQTLNLWWNAYFKTPLARGYIDPPVGGLAGRWGLFWLDAVLGVGKKGGTSLGDDWKTPEKVVENNISFLLDWYAIKYLEGSRMGSAVPANLSSVSTSDKYIDRDQVLTVKGGIRTGDKDSSKGKWEESYTQPLHFFKIKDDLVSPIHQATNATAVLVIGGGDSYDIIIRTVAMMGLNSRDIIVAKGDEFIDKISLRQMIDFDAIILYKYNYLNHDSVWNRINKYLQKGGQVFIDTGSEVKESSSVDLPSGFSKSLPDIFPIKRTKRDNIGTSWDEKITESELTEGIYIKSFSPFVFDKNPWNISHPLDREADLTDQAKVLVSVHGYPVVAEKQIGEGKLIWSGINLPYHALYNYNLEEGKLFVNILKRLVDFGQKSMPSTQLQWVSSTKRRISSTGAKGVLVKEQAFDGWSASVRSEKGNADINIYKVGPSSPGFMYARIPINMRDSLFTVAFSFNGSGESWLTTIISLITVLFALDYLIFNGRLLVSLPNKIWGKVYKRIHHWWHKEEE